MEKELPYRAEYAKTNRAGCKGCKLNIAKDSLRMAVMVQSPFFDGKMPNWFHYMCFFGKQRPKCVGDIAHFESLKWDDQEKIRAKIESGGAPTPESTAKGKAKKRKPDAAAVNGDPTIRDFSVEYAKSGRAVCIGCNEKILKGEVRVGKKDYEAESAKRFGPVDRWHHLECFEQRREELAFPYGGEVLPGFKTLGKDDQIEVKTKLKAIEIKKEVKDEPDTVNGPAKKPKMEGAIKDVIKEQNKKMFSYRDKLKKNLSKKELQDLLEYNDQQIPAGESRILDRLADCMTFGAPVPCDVCKGGQFVYRSGVGYQCLGDLTEWTKCTNIVEEPKRVPFKSPDELNDDYPFLKNFKYVVRKRAFLHEAPSMSSSSIFPKTGTKTIRKGPPLRNMKFVIVGKTEHTKAELKDRITNLGGSVVTKIDETTAAVISTTDEVASMSKKIKEAESHNIQVVSEDFLDEAEDGGIPLLIRKKSICTWGSDPEKRLNAANTVKSQSGASVFKSGVKSMKMTVKGGAVVDPASELAHKAHVLKQGSEIYNAVLGMVDIASGKNSYYKLQILESDKGSKWWVFRAWGRVGTTIGGNKVEDMEDKTDAMEHFCSLYEEKTGNSWHARKNFQKIPGRFYPMEIDYGEEDEKVKKLTEEISKEKSTLAKPVQDLVAMIFDVEEMKKAMLEFEIDLTKMPLGKLSRRQIEKAYSVLTEVQNLLAKEGAKPTAQILDASNRFYTLIPHDFGMNAPPLLDSEERIKQNVEMLDNLLEIEVAYNLLATSDEGSKKSSIDVHYEKLNTKIEVLDPTAEEYKLLKQYVENTHAPTHSSYTLEIMQIFKIKREGEDKRFKPFQKLPNHQLLWHGSRVTNYAGILSQGLRIAPPEAPVTGYMFGKGVYFADMVTKSANYCNASKTNPVGLMLLSEVALGNMYELTQAKHIVKPPKGHHSTKGLGMTEPNPEENVVLPTGVVVPCGKPHPSKTKGASLLYNEYIVYDVAQVNVQYLFQMKFNYKY